MAEELEAGTAYLQLMASARDLQGDVSKKVKKVKAPDILAKIDGEISGLEKKVAKARELKAAAETKAVAKIDAEIGGLEKKAAQAAATMAQLRAKAADPQIGLDIAELQSKAAVVRADLERLRALDATPKVDADIAAGEAKLGRFESRMAALEARRSTVQLDADTSRLQAEIDGAEARVAELNAARATAHADVDTSRFDAEIDAAESKLRRLEARRATIKIGQEGGRPTEQTLDDVDGKRRRVDGSRASVSIAAAGGAQASGMLGAIVAGLAAVAAAAPAAVAGVGAVLGAASSGGQVLGAVKAGFSGIGDAIKSVESDEKSAATSSAGAASSRSSSAGQIASAQAAVTQAVTAQARASITGGEQVADAARAQARAVVQAGRTQITAGQQVADSRRAVTDAVVASASRTADAERSLGRAQDSVRYAQEALTRSRRDAVEANEDLQLSVSGTAIAERRAALNLKKAQAARDAGGGDSEELQLDVDEAVQNLAEVRERYGDLREQQTEWARSGVAGNQQVVSATRSLASAQDTAQDSARALLQTQRDGARQVQDAAVASARAQQQAAWQVEDAQAAVTDAAIAAGRAARDAGWQQQDAAAGVEAAQRGLQQALASTAESAGSAGSAGKKSAYDLAQLTQAGRDYVGFWSSEWKPALDGVSDAVAGELLPRMITAQRSLISLFPELSRGLAGTGAVVGDLAIKGGQLATSGAFRRDFASIMDSNNRSLSSYGDAALSGVDSVRALTVAGLPLSERLARTADYAMQGVESFLLQKESTGELGQAMELGATKAGQLLGVASDLVGMGYELVVALQPVGSVVLDVVGGVASATAEFIKANPALVQFIATAGIGIATVNGLAKATVALQASYGIATGGLKTLSSFVGTALVPNTLAQTSAFSSASRGATNLGLATSTLTTGLTGSVGAGNAAGKAIGSVGRFAVGAATYLPLVGTALAAGAIAADAFGTSASEAADALAKGGGSAASMRAELAENDAAFVNSTSGFDAFNDSIARGINSMLGIRTTSADARAELDKQRASMSNLELAQSLATEAQGNYEQAVKDFGASSPQATGAMVQLKDRTRDVEIAQIAVREKVDLATAAVLYQRDQLLGALDANLRARQAAQQLARDQQAVADAIKNSGAGSQEAIDAGLQLEGSQLRAAQAARDSAGGQQAYIQSIKDMVGATKGQFTPTLNDLVAGMDLAGLSAIGAKVEFDQAGQAVARFPDGKTVVLNAQTQQAMLGLDGVALKLGQVPGNKQITVGTLSADAEAKLTGIGFTVTHLPNGQVQVTANDAMARGTLIAFQQFAAWQVANPQLAADPARANEAMRGFLVNAGQQTGVPMLDANPQRADQQVRDAVGRYNTTWSTMPVTSNPAEADRHAAEARGRAGMPVAFGLSANPDYAGISGFFRWLGDMISGAASSFGHVFGREGMNEVRGAMGLPPVARGGLVPGHASGGLLRGPGTGTSDSILGLDSGGMATARVSAGEYVVNADTTRRLGVRTMDAINGLHSGGLVGYAAGGTVAPTVGGPADPAAPAAVVAPAGDPAAAATAASATDSLTGSMTAAQVAAATLNPELAALAATQTGLVVPATAAVTLGQQQLVAAGVTPLVGSLLTTLFPTLATYDQQVGVSSVLANQQLQGAQTGTQLSTSATALNTAVNAASMTASTTGMSLASQAQLAGLRFGQDFTQASTYAMALNNAGQNNAIMSSTGFMSATNQGHLAALRGAQGVTSQATTAFADAWRAQLGRTMPDSADPIRWVINFPMRSLTDAWNNLDGQFALGKHVNPYLPGFAAGGLLRGPGTGTSDSILGVGADGVPTARVSTGEYVVREAVARRVTPFLSALNSGNGEAMQAAGAGAGRARTFHGRSGLGLAGGGPVEERINAAMSWLSGPARGARYVYGGGTNPRAGMDCSSMQSAVTHILSGRNPDSGRIGTTASMPWGGFSRGQGSRYVIGNKPNDHMAGTLAGRNVEQHGPTGTPFSFPSRWGADAPYFTSRFFLPEVGGAFVSGGVGGGIDIGPIIDAAFAKTYQQIGDVPKFFGPSAQVGRDQGVAKASADAVKAKATEAVSAATASSGVMDVSGISGAVVDQVRQVAARYGWGQGPEWDAIFKIVAKESSWDPGAASPISSARGLFQKMTSLNGPVEPTPAGQAAWGLNYIKNRYGTPTRAWAFHQSHNWYDDGGMAEGKGVMLKNVMAPERVLSPVETRNYNTLESTLGRNGMRIDTADLAGSGPATFPDRVRLEARGLELRGDGLIDIIDGHLVGLAETINDGG